MIGERIRVVSNDEAERADFVVCMPVGQSAFTDNLTGACHDCGRAIMFRPHAPKRPPKICVTCMFDREEGGKA